MSDKSGTTRREILKGAAGAALATGIASCFPGVGGQWPDSGGSSEAGGSTCGCGESDSGAPANSDDQPTPIAGAALVATIQRSDSVDARGKSTAQAQLDVVQGMVDAVLSVLAGGATNPWSVLLPSAGPCTRIGLKVNCLNSSFPTSPALVRALIQNLINKGNFCAGNIVVWDRRLDELNNYGKYSSTDLQGAQLLGTVHSTTDAGGPGYGTTLDEIGGYRPSLSRILTEHTDVTINCPVLKRHGQSGVTAALKNIYGIIDMPGNFHGDLLQTALPLIYRTPQIRKSIQLTIVDALQAVALGDTSDRPDCLPGRIFASTDPLGLDHYALDLVNQLRAGRNQPAIDGTIVAWMDNAYQLGIGRQAYQLVSLPLDGSQAVDGGDSLDANTF